MNAEKKIQLSEVLVSTGHFLDAADYDSYLDLFCDDAEYQVVSYVPEIASEDVWMDYTKSELQHLLNEEPYHHWNTGQRTHFISTPLFENTTPEVSTLASVVIYRTDTDGRTDIYAVGQYKDNWIESKLGWRLKKRVLHLATRDLVPPSAIPL